MSVINKIKELGYELPVAPKPVAAYISATQTGNLVFTSGVLPMKEGKLLYTNKIESSPNSIEHGVEAAKLCTLNALSIINDFVGIDNIEKVVKLTGFVKSENGFTGQPVVINGASELLVEIFGESGKHVRSAIGVNELPLGAAVELEMIVQVKS